MNLDAISNIRDINKEDIKSAKIGGRKNVNHLKALAIKFIVSFLLLFVVLGLLFQYSFSVILGLTLILGLVSYILGDLMLLPRTSNFTATISDFAIAMLLTWFYLATITTYATNVFIASLITAIGVALFESVFHRYMRKNVLHEKESHVNIGNLRYTTEVSEEISPDYHKIKED